MSAYVIAQINVTDPETYDRYRAQAAPTLEPHGARFLVRGGELAVLEGEMPYSRVVVIEFPSLESAKVWHESQAYEGPKALRQAASEGLMFVVDGYAG